MRSFVSSLSIEPRLNQEVAMDEVEVEALKGSLVQIQIASKAAGKLATEAGFAD